MSSTAGRVLNSGTEKEGRGNKWKVKKQKLYVCMAACLLQKGFEKKWALNVTFFYNSKKEHHYFTLNGRQPVCIPASKMPLPIPSNVKLYVGWHISITLLLILRTFFQSVSKHTSRQISQKVVWRVVQVICGVPQIMYPSAITYNQVVASFSSSFMTFKQQFKTCCGSSC